MRDKESTYDTQIENALVWLKPNVGSIRNLRDLVLSAADELRTAGPQLHAVLLLPEPGISSQRLHAEHILISRTIRPELAERITFLAVEGNKPTGYPHDPSPATLEKLLSVFPPGYYRPSANLPRPNYGVETMKLLLVRWVNKKGFMSLNELYLQLGCSHPTAAKALDELKPYLKRGPNRGFALSRFPDRAWEQFIVTGKTSRSTRRFVDRSGQPRSIARLIGNLKRQGRPDIALGGVPGAMEFFPRLNISGVPRLDLTVHCPSGVMDADFVQRLDPALQESSDLDEPAAVVVHALRRATHDFITGSDGQVAIADPIECLADLQEARLEMQAEEFKNDLQARATG